jgi:hypothetical protein
VNEAGVHAGGRSEVVVILTWLASNLAGAACTPVPAADVRSAVAEADGAFGVDPTAFGAAASRAVSLAECLAEPTTPDLAAGVHRVEGLRLLVAGDDLGSQRALTASLRIDPTYVPAGAAASLGPVLDRARASLKPVPTTPMRLHGFVVQVDGKPATERPVDGPYLLQVLDPKGVVEVTQYVAAGEDPQVPREVRALASANASMQMYLPELTIMPTPLAYTATRPPVDGFGGPRISDSHGGGGSGNKVLLWSGVAVGGVAAGLYGTSAWNRVQYDRIPTPQRYSLTNGTYLGSLGAATVSSVLITTFFLTK